MDEIGLDVLVLDQRAIQFGVVCPSLYQQISNCFFENLCIRFRRWFAPLGNVRISNWLTKTFWGIVWGEIRWKLGQKQSWDFQE
jgi:hypothetical protein